MRHHVAVQEDPTCLTFVVERKVTEALENDGITLLNIVSSKFAQVRQE
jgi:hypothetical protein